MTDFYATGGTLLPNAPSYIPRQADTELYQALKQGQFCYILNSRQMGKSSLAAQVAAQLRQDSMKIAQFELQLTYDATPEQWYNTLLTKMGRMLGIRKQLDTFWRNNPTTPVQRWMQAIHEVILTHFKQPVILCIDEIDIVRSLPFATDDFFAAIRSCYNERAQNPDLQRLTFCLVGTARPTDLITDAQATPFDIGQAIELTGFTFAEAMPLAQGLQDKADNPEAVLRAILEWTGGQPFLTQKVCELFWRHTDAPLASGQETAYVAQLIQTHIIEHWQDKDDPPHLLTIRDRLIKRDNRQDTWQLLGLCRSILSLSQPENMLEAQVMELRLTGLMVKQPGGQLQVFNKIYLKMAEEQKNKALFRESLFLAEIARQQIEQGNATTAVLLALEALPQSFKNPNRPFVPEVYIQLKEAVSILENSVTGLNMPSLINHARKLVAGKELTPEQKKKFFLKGHLPTLLEFIAEIDPKFVETLTSEQREKFSINELDVLGKELLSKWVEQLTPEQGTKWVEQLEREQHVVTRKHVSTRLVDMIIQWWERLWYSSEEVTGIGSR